MAAVILSVLLAVAVQRTTAAEVAQYREIVETYRSGRNMEAIREVETLPQAELTDDLRATAAAFRRYPMLLAPGVDERRRRRGVAVSGRDIADSWCPVGDDGPCPYTVCV
jgi:hypothetical protein